MARPSKSVKTMSKNLTKEEIDARTKVEEQLRGEVDNISPPNYLNSSQKKIFNYIVDELQASGILGNLDVYILSDCAFAIDQLEQIKKDINKAPKLKYDKAVKGARESFQNTFFRCCNELSLSPQSRAKLGNINFEQKMREDDPLLQVLAGDGD